MRLVVHVKGQIQDFLKVLVVTVTPLVARANHRVNFFEAFLQLYGEPSVDPMGNEHPTRLLTALQSVQSL